MSDGRRRSLNYCLARRFDGVWDFLKCQSRHGNERVLWIVCREGIVESKRRQVFYVIFTCAIDSVYTMAGKIHTITTRI